jgi:hypothetical protein
VRTQHTATDLPLSADLALSTFTTALSAGPALTMLCTPLPALCPPRTPQSQRRHRSVDCLGTTSARRLLLLLRLQSHAREQGRSQGSFFCLDLDPTCALSLPLLLFHPAPEYRGSSLILSPNPSSSPSLFSLLLHACLSGLIGAGTDVAVGRIARVGAC